jgi:hypothetical protein
LVGCSGKANYFTLPVSFSAAHHHSLSQQLLLPDVNCRDIVRCDDDDDDDDDLRPGSGGVSGWEKRQKPPQQQDQQLQGSSTQPKTIHTERRKTKRNTGPNSSQEWARQENQVNERLDSSQNNNSKVITTGIKQVIKQASKRIIRVSFFLLFFQGNT